MFTPQIEFQPREVIKTFQEELLREMVIYVGTYSPFYKRMFSEHGIDVSKIKTIEDLKIIPFTTKQDLQLYNDDFICVERDKIADYVTTSGTLSTPTTFALTRNDLDRLAYNEAISFECAGGHSGEVYQLMTTIDKRFMAGLAYFMGVIKMGGSMIRVGNGIPELQWDTINRIKPDAIVCVPSFILRIIQYAEEHGIDYKNSSIKKAICIGENLREQDFSLNLLGRKITEKWDIQLHSTYASTEMGHSFTECSEGQGGHHHPELLICEIVDDVGNPVPEGEYGELVITTLGVEGMPLLRFKTGDITSFHYEPCACGRTTMRVSPLVGRKNHMIKLKGTTLYPSTIFDVLDSVPYVVNYIVEVSHNEIGTDTVSVVIGSRESDHEWMTKDLKDRFRAKIRVAPDIKYEDIDKITQMQMPEGQRKPMKFLDKR